MSEVLVESFTHIRRLAKDIESILRHKSITRSNLENELAGMFAVSIAASYEGIVKETLISYAANIHSKYQNYVEIEFKKMNAKISIDDLKSYSNRFGLAQWTGQGAQRNKTTFDRILTERKLVVERRFRADLFVSYKNIIIWRNAYAHERTNPTTFRDVHEAHRVAQYVIRSFVAAFEYG